MGPEFEALKAEITRNTTVDSSVIALVNKLAALRADPAAFNALVAELRGSSDQVEAAVLANTPSEPTP